MLLLLFVCLFGCLFSCLSLSVCFCFAVVCIFKHVFVPKPVEPRIPNKFEPSSTLWAKFVNPAYSWNPSSHKSLNNHFEHFFMRNKNLCWKPHPKQRLLNLRPRSFKRDLRISSSLLTSSKSKTNPFEPLIPKTLNLYPKLLTGFASCIPNSLNPSSQVL